MGLLAERRSKSRWGDDPRGKKWSDDKNKKSVKMMEKMGWTFGNGIGANEDGRKEHVKIRLKQDNRGVGCSLKYDRQWVAHQDAFSDILADLNSTTDAPAERVLADTVQVSSLADTGSKAGHRYGKFTKAKDLTGASAKHLEEIFGRSSASVAKDKAKKEAEEAAEKAKAEANKSEVCESGKFKESSKHVIATESVYDYFKRKMAEKLAREALPTIKNEQVEDEAETETLAIKAEEVVVKNEPQSDSEEVAPPKKKKKRKKNRDVQSDDADKLVKEEVEVKQEIVSDAEAAQEPVKKKKKRKKQQEEREADVASAENEDNEEEPPKKVKKSKKKKAKEPVEEAEELPAEIRKDTTEEVGEEMQSPELTKKAKKKKKKSKS